MRFDKRDKKYIIATQEVVIMLFEEAHTYYKILASKRLKKQSFEKLQYDFNSHILPYFKNRHIEDLEISDIIEWQNEILSKNFSNSYNNSLYTEFNSFFRFCCDYYNLPCNIVSKVGNFKKKYEEKRSDFYTIKEFKRFIKCVDNNIYKQFFNLMFFTGTRPSEAMALKFSDLQGDYISITKSIQRKGKREIDTPKNKSSIRKIKIDNFLKRDLLKLKKDYITKYGNFNENYFIFGGIKPLSPTSIDRYKEKACFKAHLRPITLHQFRHSHATLLLQNGIIINEISRRLGHSRVSTTLNIYTHTDLAQEKRAINTLNSLRFDILEIFKYIF